MSEKQVTTEAALIDAAHPMRTNRYDLYAEAMRLVGERMYPLTWEMASELGWPRLKWDALCAIRAALAAGKATE